LAPIGHPPGKYSVKLFTEVKFIDKGACNAPKNPGVTTTYLLNAARHYEVGGNGKLTAKSIFNYEQSSNQLYIALLHSASGEPVVKNRCFAVNIKFEYEIISGFLPTKPVYDEWVNPGGYPAEPQGTIDASGETRFPAYFGPLYYLLTHSSGVITTDSAARKSHVFKITGSCCPGFSGSWHSIPNIGDGESRPGKDVTGSLIPRKQNDK
jgi:hypothetical protein